MGLIPSVRVCARIAGDRNLASADQNRLARKLYAEPLAHGVLDRPRKIEELAGGGSSAVDQREGVFARDADVAARVAFFKARVLDEPGRRYFRGAVGRRKFRELLLCGEAGLEECELILREDGVNEERPCAHRFRIVRIDDHPLPSP